MKTVVIFVDGAVRGNPGDGGWAARLEMHRNGKPIHVKELSGCRGNVTNNHMEFQAIVEALDALKQDCDVTLYTDSVVAAAWYRKNPPATNEYAHQLKSRLTHILQRRNHRIKIVNVKGHSGVVGNERVDQIAFAVARGLPIPEEENV